MAVQSDASDVIEAAGPYDRAKALNAFKFGDVTFYWITRLSAISVLLILGGIIVSLIIGAWPAMKEYGFAFLWTQRWAPSADPPVLGALGPMYGTLVTSFIAMLIAILLGIPLGLWAGLKPNSLAGRSIMAGSILGFSLPTFWVGLMLIMVFSVMLGWLPSNGRGPTTLLFGIPVSFTSVEGWRHLILPATNLALFKLALLIRLTRAGTREALLQDYVKFARAKGLSNSRVIGVHVLRNILIPIVTVIGLEFGSVIAFAIVTESVFAWPGMGKLLIDSINLLDRPIIVAYLLVIVFMFIVINLFVDVLYSALDPRVRLADGSD